MTDGGKLISGLRVERADLADFLISGTFDFSDARGLLDYLTRFERVTVTRMADGVIVLKRNEAEAV